MLRSILRKDISQPRRLQRMGMPNPLESRQEANEAFLVSSQVQMEKRSRRSGEGQGEPSLRKSMGTMQA